MITRIGGKVGHDDVSDKYDFNNGGSVESFFFLYPYLSGYV